jgi:hypothetical protein
LFFFDDSGFVLFCCFELLQVESNLRLWRMLLELQEREQLAQAQVGRESYDGLGCVRDEDDQRKSTHARR